MPSQSRTNRFQSFTPLRSTTGSLRRLRTAFSPTRSSLRSASPSSILTSSTSTCPLTRASSPHSTFRSSNRASDASLRQVLAVHRRPSVREFELELAEEKQLFGLERLDVMEPRPGMLGLGFGAGASEVCVVGIFEVLEGAC